jgi:lipopolysaccharide transport system permease protein
MQLTDIADVPVVRVQRTHGWRPIDIGELLRSRELAYFLTWRDIRVRYKQTIFGAAWAVLQPLLGMAIFTVFFAILVHVPSDGVPYPLFAYAGLLPWMYFANATSTASASVVNNASLLSKVYFPRLLVPLAGVLSNIMDLIVGVGLLLGLALIFGNGLSLRVLWMPVFAVLAALSALAVSLWLSALDVKYRDVRHTIPFLLQAWMFASPVLYPASLIPEEFRLLYSLNPMAAVVEGFRWSVLNQTSAMAPYFPLSALVIVVLFVGGLFFFRRVERTFSDVL